MNILSRDWFKRSIVLIVVSMIVSGFMFLLDYTDWAEAMKTAELTHEHDEANREELGMLIYVLPFVKVFAFIGIPSLICFGIWKGIQRFAK